MAVVSNSALVTRLMEIQGPRSDSEMGAMFGVTRSYWCMLRSGKRYPSLKFVTRALELWPELTGYHLLDVQPRKAGAA